MYNQNMNFIKKNPSNEAIFNTIKSYKRIYILIFAITFILIWGLTLSLIYLSYSSQNKIKILVIIIHIFILLIISITIYFNYSYLKIFQYQSNNLQKDNKFKVIAKRIFWIPIINLIIMPIIIFKKYKLLINSAFINDPIQQNKNDCYNWKKFWIIESIISSILILFLLVGIFNDYYHPNHFSKLINNSILFLLPDLILILILNKIMFINYFKIESNNQKNNKILIIFGWFILWIPLISTLVWILLYIIKKTRIRNYS